MSELGALADLATEGFDGAVARVAETHAAIAARTPASGAHDAIARAVYAGVRGTGRVVGAGAAAAIRARGGGPRLSATPGGRLAQGALNGLYGDRLERAGSALAVPMAVRAGGRDIAPAEVAGAGPRPVVFLHGLGEDDAAWSLRRGERGGTYATRVLAPLGRTPVTIRYNTGLPIAENGRRLDALLDELVATWPVPVECVALVGHSMGGLVIRAAAHAASERGPDAAWPALVDASVSLGTPHRGAPLEQAVALAARGLGVFPESRAFQTVVDSRSAGIKDLRRGLRDEVPLLPGARHHAVAATLTADAGHPVARAVGDLLVLTASAHGIDADTLRHVGGHDHFDLLNSPALDELLREWLAVA
jgi:pimeloyl-ACP methyl ester carboxylesterase